METVFNSTQRIKPALFYYTRDELSRIQAKNE